MDSRKIITLNYCVGVLDSNKKIDSTRVEFGDVPKYVKCFDNEKDAISFADELYVDKDSIVSVYNILPNKDGQAYGSYVSKVVQA